MNKYQRRILYALLEIEFDKSEKGTLDNTQIMSGAIFSHIKHYEKNKTQYERALVVCVTMGYISTFVDHNMTHYRVADLGIKALNNWKERLITATIAVTTSLITTLITVLIKGFLSPK